MPNVSPARLNMWYPVVQQLSSLESSSMHFQVITSVGRGYNYQH